jgi:hypothetical protein
VNDEGGVNVGGLKPVAGGAGGGAFFLNIVAPSRPPSMPKIE